MKFSMQGAGAQEGGEQQGTPEPVCRRGAGLRTAGASEHCPGS